MDISGREHTAFIMSKGGEFALLILLLGVAMYLWARYKGYRSNFILFFILYLFPSSVLYVDLGFHLFYHRILLMLLFIWFLFSKISRLNELSLIINSTTLAGFYFLMMCLPGLLVCIDFGEFWKWWISILVGILLYIMIYDQIKTKKNLEAIIFSCILTGFAWSVIGLVLFLTGNQTLEADDIKKIYRLSALSKDANFFASTLIFWMQLSFFWFLRKDGQNKIFGFVALFTMVMAFPFTYSRGAFLALSVVIALNFFYFFFLKSKMSESIDFRKLKIFLVCAMIIMCGGFTLIGSLRDRVVSIKTDEKLGAGRGYIWMDAMNVIKENPLGVGLNNYKTYTLKYRHKYETAGSSVHNAFLHVTAETGILGFLSYILFIGTILIKIRHVLKIEDVELFHWYLGSFAAIIGILVCSIFISNIYRENFFIAIAIFLSIYNVHRKISADRAL